MKMATAFAVVPYDTDVGSCSFPLEPAARGWPCFARFTPDTPTGANETRDPRFRVTLLPIPDEARGTGTISGTSVSGTSVPFDAMRDRRTLLSTALRPALRASPQAPGATTPAGS